eukprot:scaffold1770_cov375-Prasinococcus_capsulatus_cf.AAC.25
MIRIDLCLLLVPGAGESATEVEDTPTASTATAVLAEKPRSVKRRDRQAEARLEENLQRAKLAAGKSRTKSKLLSSDNLLFICIGGLVAFLLLLLVFSS